MTEECVKTGSVLSAGTSDPEELAAAKRHIASCPSCKARLSEASEERRTALLSADGGTLDLDAAPAPGAAAPAPADKLARGEAIGRYVVLDVLGEGGMGVVYGAYDPELDRKVAIKLVRAAGARSGTARQERQARLLREAQAMARIHHPNVVVVHDVGTFDEGVFVAMEFIQGRTLRTWLKERDRPWRETLRLFVEAGHGLEAAHRAGLIHRDFKPDNVLLDDDGRVVVTDFGLARLSDGADSSASASGLSELEQSASSFLADDLTQAGAVMGTPFYMSPEQFAGRRADERSDQFSFCAALYWGLFQARPFEPDALRALANALLKEQERAADFIKPPPDDRGVPARVRRAIARGLRIDPAARFRSMTELLQELDTVLQRRRRGRVVAAVSAVALAAVAAAGGQRVASARAQLCTGGPAEVAGAWSPDHRARMAARFAQVSGAEGEAQVERTAAALDRYAAEWAAMHQEACRATRLRGEQSEAVLALRMSCLDRRRKELRSLTSLLVAADAAAVKQSVDAALALSTIRPCADVSALTELQPVPEDPAARAQVEALSAELAEVNALRIAGQYALALERAARAAEQAKALRYRPLEAEALYYRGLLEERTGKARESERTLVAAGLAAEAARDDSLRIRIAARLLYVASQQNRFDEGRAWEAAGRAVLERVGGNPELEGELLNNAAALLMEEGRGQEAAESYRRAFQLLDAELGKDSIRRVLTLGNLAAALLNLDRADEAVPMLREAVAGIERLRGPDHPTVSAPLSNLAMGLTKLRQFAPALEAADRGLAVARLRFGPDHTRVMNALDLKATVLQEAGRFDEALAVYRESLAIKERTKAAGPHLSHSYDGIGQCLLGLGKPIEALPLLERALKLRGPDPSARADTRFAIARALWTARRDPARARKSALDAIADYTAAGQTAKVSEVQRWLEVHAAAR
jgi:tRNA A-37 threonylcarbamoyl transferase component Bud32/tetratricopeptide (TPR) repeat protein